MSVYWCQISYCKHKLWVNLCFCFSITVEVDSKPKSSLKQISLAFSQDPVHGKLYFGMKPLSTNLWYIIGQYVLFMNYLQIQKWIWYLVWRCEIDILIIKKVIMCNNWIVINISIQLVTSINRVIFQKIRIALIPISGLIFWITGVCKVL